MSVLGATANAELLDLTDVRKQIIWLGIFQYCFVRVLMTIIAVITEAAGLYCLESLSPAYAHVWVSL